MYKSKATYLFNSQVIKYHLLGSIQVSVTTANLKNKCTLLIWNIFDRGHMYIQFDSKLLRYPHTNAFLEFRRF
jgi:hypothetical protein